MWVAGRSVRTAAAVCDGAWHHVAVVWSAGGAGAVTVYVDAAPRLSAALAPGAAIPDGGSLLLGQVGGEGGGEGVDR